MVKEERKFTHQMIAIGIEGFEEPFVIPFYADRQMTRDEFMENLRKATEEYCKTDEGKKILIGNAMRFNLGDVDAFVPDSILEKYGLRKENDHYKTIPIDMGENLFNENAYYQNKEEEEERES